MRLYQWSGENCWILIIFWIFFIFFTHKNTFFMDRMWSERRQERWRCLVWVTKRIQLPSSEVNIVKSRAGLVVGWLQTWIWWVWNIYYISKHVELAVKYMSLKYRKEVWTSDIIWKSLAYRWNEGHESQWDAKGVHIRMYINWELLKEKPFSFSSVIPPIKK